MKKSILLAAISFGLASLPSARAQTWNLAAGGSWNTPGNWNPSGVPNSIGASATFNGAANGSNPAQPGNRPVTMDAAQPVGSLTFNNDWSTFPDSLTPGTSGSLIFVASGAGPATITTMGT